MKRMLIMLIITILLFSLSACQGSEETTATQTNTSEPTVYVLPTEESSFAPTGNEMFKQPPEAAFQIPEGATALTDTELEWFNTVFFVRDTHEDVENLFLLSWYKSPENVDLFEVFYGGVAEQQEISAEERDALIAACAEFGGDCELDIFCTTSEAMDTALRKHIGLSLEETNRIGLDRYIYLESYDAYYIAHSDTNGCRHEMLEGYHTEDGQIVMLYEPQSMLDQESKLALVTLKPTEDGTGYYFVSNQPYPIA